MPNIEELLATARGLIFDCDGTLVDTPPLYARAWAAGLRLSGRDMSHDWYFQRAGMSEGKLMDHFESAHGITLARDEVIRLMRSAFIDGLPELKEIELITSIAHRNRGKLPMAVASGGSRAIVTATLAATGLAPLFDVVVTLDDVGHPKPEPHLFLEAARRIQIAPAHCLVFEDSQEGLEAAHRAGIPAIDVLQLLNPQQP